MVKTFTSPGGYTVVVGKDARENDKILSEAKCSDLWFHASDNAGPHVIMKCNHIPNVAENDIRFSAKLAKERGEVVYCYVADVFKPRKASPGSVIISNEKIIIV